VEEIRRAVSVSGIGTVQLHGEETPAFCSDLKALLPGLGVIKALRPRSREELSQLAAYIPSCEAILLDTYMPGFQGGTGVTGDWSLAALGARQCKIILAGGLNPGNIEAALATPDVFAVDVSSGLESRPGQKSHAKMRLFFENAKNVLKTERSSHE